MPEDPSTNPRPSEEGDGKGHVLVIDDEADIRESLETLLSLEGYTVDVAQNGTEGLRALESKGYDLVLLDLMMPDRSGMEVLREVRERDTETPIFLITAYGSVEAAVEALKSGANDYFSRPWDNYYRLNMINIALPALRERKEDIPLLTEHFFTKYCRENDKFLDAARMSTLRFQPEAMQILMDHNWPGNVRELENVVERAVVLSSDEAVPVEVFPEYLLLVGGVRLHRGDGPLPPDASLYEIVADFERRTIIERLEQTGWSQTEAADSLHVPLSTLNQKIKRLNIDVRRKSQ